MACKFKKYQGELALVCEGYDNNAINFAIDILQMLNYRIFSYGFGQFGGNAVLISNRGKGKKIIEIVQTEDGKIIVRFIPHE